jgi:hypothetical protein
VELGGGFVVCRKRGIRKQKWNWEEGLSCAESEISENRSGTGRRVCRVQKARYPKIEGKLLEYVSEKRKFGYAVSTEMCQLKALALAKEQEIEGFKASRIWIVRFFTRNKLCIRRKTSVSQRLPNAYEEKILCFQKYITNLRRQNSCIVSQIGNARPNIGVLRNAP